MKKGSVSGKKSAGRIELAGLKFGRLLVIQPIRKPNIERLFWECKCDCGNIVVVGAQDIRKGSTQSCGCLQKERTSQASFKHGMSHTPMHDLWMSMIQRCSDPNCKAFKDYGGRGIKVCDRWLTFTNFLEDMGFPPQKGLSLDRYPDNNGNYEPNNVRWATKKEQANNRRSNNILEYKTERLTIAQWEDRQNFPRGLISHRIYAGWTIERAISEPPSRPG